MLVRTQGDKTITITSGKRKGFSLNLTRRKEDMAKVKLSTADAPSKFSTVPHPLLKLSSAALPPEATKEYVDRAVANFSSSVTRDTQKGYATAARHYTAAQQVLGRSFSSPPSQTDLVYFITFLLGKNIGTSTIRHYLSGLRFFLMSQGIPLPPKFPPLAEQLLSGKEKADRDASAAALKKTMSYNCGYVEVVRTCHCIKQQVDYV